MAEADKAECVVVGAGPAGLAAAAAVASTGGDVCLIAPASNGRPAQDQRTAALFPASIDFIRNLGAWDALARVSAPLQGIRIVDDMGALFRAPEILFSACEIGREALGYNVPNGALAEALYSSTVRASVRAVFGSVSGLEISSDRVIVVLGAGRRIAARLVVAADGRNSICRNRAGIGVRSRTFEQSAIAATFEHGRPHHGISTEFHRPGGPLTTVPLPGKASSLVRVERPAIAARLAGLDDHAFRQALEARLSGLLGTIGGLSPRQLYPLASLIAERLGANRVALVGEAGHVLPPIGAQGLNLGLMDAAVLAEVLASVRRAGGDVGAPAALAEYHRARAGDVERRARAVDALNFTLTSNILPLELARGFGLHMLAALKPLRLALMRQGLEPAGPRPSLMQPAIDRTAPAPPASPEAA